MRKIRVKFKNFWRDFDCYDNIFTDILGVKYDVVVSDDAEYVFTGDRNYRENGKVNILYTGEPSNDIGVCDYYLSQYDTKADNYVRFPLYLYYIRDFVKNGVIPGFDFFSSERFFTGDDLSRKTGFCNFVCGGPLNGNGQYRDVFVKELMKYKRVDCPGTRFNNMPRLVGDSSDGLMASRYKRDFISRYKFTIGFENNSTKDGYDGYTSEKFIEPLVSNSMVIYWGNKYISREFNTGSFVNFHDYEDMGKVINRIIELDNNDDEYMGVMREKYVARNEYMDMDFLVSLFDKIIK